MKYLYEKKGIYNIIRVAFILIIVILISPNLLFAQIHKPQKPTDPRLHHEVKEDNYTPVDRSTQGRSPAYDYASSNIFTVQVNVDENGQNIVGDAANEPSIAVDPLDHNKMVIGWRQFNTVSNNFRQAGYGYTADGGLTWTFPGVIDPGWFRSDPVLDWDVYGNFYYNSLTNDPTYECKVFKSSNGGQSWNNGAYAQGGDKQWMTIDKIAGQGNGHIYAYWTSYYSVCYPGFFTRSTDEGASFENCVSIPDDPSWGQLVVAPDHNLYVVGSSYYDFVVARSVNAQDPNQIVSFNMSTTVSLDGAITYGIAPNPDGLGGQTNIACDTSNGLYHGYLYVLCSVQRYSNNDILDVMFSRSSNGGTSWSAPVKINSDVVSSNYHWFGTMSVAPNGRIDVVWLDTRDHPGSNISSLYYSYSTDAGTTWSANERLSDYFDPHVGWPNQQKMGDYFDMESDSSGAHLAWAGTFNNEEDVYYSYISPEGIPVELSSFSASVARNVVTLNWLTATELNNKGFEIDRSANGINWTTIGFKQGKGTTSEPQQYSYTDRLSDVSSSKLYYRLKQVDFDGTYKYSNIVEAVIAPAEFSLSQNYPNPFNPTTAISYQLPENSFVSLKVYDVLGKEVASIVNEQKAAGKYQVEFNASNLGSGVYFYTLKANGFTQSKKMMLLK